MPLPPERAYRMMQDPEVLARAMPGCESLEKIGEDEYRMKMKMALASLSGAFDGKVRITEQTPPASFRLVVEGSGKIGFVKGDGVLKLTPKDVRDRGLLRRRRAGGRNHRGRGAAPDRRDREDDDQEVFREAGSRARALTEFARRPWAASWRQGRHSEPELLNHFSLFGRFHR